MKKFIRIIVVFLFILDLFLVKASYAATSTTIPFGVDLNNQSGPNPAPPLGITCGKTMCLQFETCLKYPEDADYHCVPNDFIEKKYAPNNSETVPDLPPDCSKDSGVFPPNSSCINKMKSTRYLHGDWDTQPFEKCGIGDSGPNGPPAPGGGDFNCNVSMLAYTDVREAELGSYGPDTVAEASYSADFLAQNYLYNSLFERPLNLQPKEVDNNTGVYPNREAYRTYWRLLPAANQANLRSFILNMANEKQIDNIKFNFTDRNGFKKETDFQKLYNSLNTQVIVFLHWPFIRIGCLTEYPICPEYALAMKELEPNFQDLREAVRGLNLPAATAAVNAYEAALNLFGGDLDGPYAAFVPLDFSSVRGYIVKKKDEYEEQMYKHRPPYFSGKLIDTFNAGRNGTNKPPLTNISDESLPYVGAVYQGLLSPKFGLLPALQPQWLIDKYATPSGLSDYKMGNTPSSLPEVKIANMNFLERIKAELDAFKDNWFGWIFNQKRVFSEINSDRKGYTPIDKDNKNSLVREYYSNMKGCPLPVSYHLLAPMTKATTISEEGNDGDHHQVISIDGAKLAWNYSPTHRDLWEYKCKKIKDQWGNPIGEECGYFYDPCPTDDEHYVLGDQCYTRRWIVTGTQHGKALTVLNNPKQTDIKEAVIQNDKYSFYKMILPGNQVKTTDAGIDAMVAKNFVSDAGAATAPIGESSMLNPAEPINRINNLAQDNIHLLQNCWTVPDGLQNSPRCDLKFTAATESASICSGEAFKKIEPNPTAPTQTAQSFFDSSIKPNLTPEVIKAYAAAEQKTGVPCEVLAGIHFEEADNNPNQDLQSGAPLAGRSLTDSAIQAGEELIGKAGGIITNLNQLMMAMSYYNGGGNSNCQASGSYNCPAAVTDRCGMTVACTVDPGACVCTGSPQPGSCRSICTQGFPYQFSYNYCSAFTTGYDDPYVTNWWKSPEHDNMYLLYMYDCTQTRPQIHTRPGSLTVAIMVFLAGAK